MYVPAEEVRAVEARLGVPRVLRLRHPISPEEMRNLKASQKHGRAHDVTLFIRGPDGRFAVIRKPFYPPGAYRAPSGGLRPGEPFLAGAAREAEEETGLLVRPDRYLLRVEVVFAADGQEVPWTSHVLAATAVGGELAPRDTREVEAAAWASADQLRGPIRSALWDSGRSLLRYRVLLTDAALEAYTAP
jgi:8-oxo-dGTP pyrophosphatase MutT (NUDIX family)